MINLIMKLLNKELLLEYGFSYDTFKAAIDGDIMVKDGFQIFMKSDGSFYYSNVEIDYPLRDLAGLKKLFKEVKSKDLKPI